jgi:hypothetical protein
MEIMHCHDVMLHIVTRASCTCYVDSWHVQNDIDARLSGINLSFAAFTLRMGIDTSRVSACLVPNVSRAVEHWLYTTVNGAQSPPACRRCICILCSKGKIAIT